jgi:choline dehydrogenase-like flavoprotein
VNLYLKLRQGRFAGVVKTLKQNAERASGLPVRLRTLLDARAARARGGGAAGTAMSERVYSLYFRSEQAPDPASRVTLSDRRDALGMPEARLDWRVNRVDLDAVTRWLSIFGQEIGERGLGRVVAPLPGWEDEIIGGPHHMGTTRMSADPQHGVVDADCRVHTVENLYIAGASVFATGGYANPTFTLIALALRLADTLRDRLRDKLSLSSGS